MFRVFFFSSTRVLRLYLGFSNSWCHMIKNTSFHAIGGMFVSSSMLVHYVTLLAHTANEILSNLFKEPQQLCARKTLVMRMLEYGTWSSTAIIGWLPAILYQLFFQSTNCVIDLKTK